jgi:hypothetical protein
VTRFQGSKGSLELREFSVTFVPQPGVDTSPSYYSSSFPAAARDAYVKKWHAEHDPVPGKEPAPESITFNGDDYDDLKPHLWKFFESVRSRKPLVQDAVFGHNAALAAIWRMNRTSARRRCIGMRLRQRSSRWGELAGNRAGDTLKERGSRENKTVVFAIAIAMVLTSAGGISRASAQKSDVSDKDFLGRWDLTLKAPTGSIPRGLRSAIRTAR